MAKTVEMTEVAVSLLRPYGRNAKKHPQEQIEKLINSIQEFGFISPCLIDKENRIIAGHGRVQAAKQIGMDKVPCVYIEGLTEEQRRAYIIADNRLTELGGWDMDIVFEELEDLDDIGFDIELTGFDLPEEEPEITEDDFNVEDVPTETTVKTGDIWQLGDHRLICGDSTDVDTVKKLMGGEVADIGFTSPPYNVGTGVTEVTMNKTSKYNGNDDNKTDADYTEFLDLYIQATIENAQYVFCNIQSLANNKTALIEVLNHNKDIYADTIIWDKGHSAPAMAKNVLNSTFEYIHVFSKKATRSIGTIEFHGNIDNIFHLPPQRKNEYSAVHNATFSVEFASWFISRFAKNSVLDSFGGTGTTLIACEQLGRKCFMIELDPLYCDIIIQRWEKFTGKKAVKVNG